MTEVEVCVDGALIRAPAGSSVVAALVIADTLCTRRSVTGELRFAVCGIGQCHECRVTVDGTAHRLACQLVCQPGMVITTGAREGP